MATSFPPVASTHSAPWFGLKTLHLKVHPSCWPWLDQAAREVNRVWNFANATRRLAARPFFGAPRYLSAYDLDKLVAGCGEVFERIGIDVAQRVVHEFVTRCTQEKQVGLRFRKSGGSRRSLGWIPFKGANLRLKGDRLRFLGKSIRLFASQKKRFLEHRAVGGKARDGSFAQNALGEWFLNVPVEVQAPEGTVFDAQGVPQFPPAPRAAVGLDPGLKAVLTTSDGEVFEPNRSYRDLEPKIARAQRRGHKRQAKRYHQKARNQRLHQLHAVANQLITGYQQIFLGNASPRFLASGRSAKAGLDSGCGTLKTLLLTKGHRAGRSVRIVPECNTTRACSDCGALTGPAGSAMLAVRQWECSACNACHDRDVNAAANILKRGLAMLQQTPLAAPMCSRTGSRKSSPVRRPSAGTR